MPDDLNSLSHPETNRLVGDAFTPESPTKSSALSPTKRKNRIVISTIITPIVLLLYAYVGVDILHVPLRRLSSLHLPYAEFLSYTPLYALVAAAVIWLVFRKKIPLLAMFFSILLCIVILNVGQSYAVSQVENVAVNRWLTEREKDPLERRLSFPICQEESSGGGIQIFLAKNSDQRRRLMSELSQYNGLLPDTAATR